MFELKRNKTFFSVDSILFMCTVIFLAVSLAMPLTSYGARIKELAYIDGVRNNQLIGYGIVIGLNGTGDKANTIFTTQSLANMLDKMGIKVDPNAIKVKNVAAVMVTANLPPFSKAGTTIDVTVSSIGDATSLLGGVLLMTPLRGADGEVYAVAQGPLVV
ncbi:MAG TPA: flagellar basal body P-ring protein FlgI, partial [Syntrophorhabdaceae bacterium]|nr:flagellar basal body P-ring protein FlgI [Syntrophorhabdaceae bacterium]